MGFRTEEARHLTGQFRVERLVDGGEHTATQQARDQILGANVELLGQIFDADAFGDGDVARDRHRLIRHHHARRRRIALHRAFLHAARNVALAGPASWSARTAARTSGTWRWKPRANSERTSSHRRLAGGMHRAPLPPAPRRRGAARHFRTAPPENWPPRAPPPRGPTLLPPRPTPPPPPHPDRAVP